MGKKKKKEQIQICNVLFVCAGVYFFSDLFHFPNEIDNVSFSFLSSFAYGTKKKAFIDFGY